MVVRQQWHATGHVKQDRVYMEAGKYELCTNMYWVTIHIISVILQQLLYTS
jgi:hypothetical protein